MESDLTRHWWVLVLRGMLGILFGVLVFLWPDLFWLAFVYVFAAYALIDGFMALFAAVTGHGQAGRWWALLLQGLVSIAVGVVAFIWPPITMLAILFLIAGWCLLTGVLEIVTAIELRKQIRGEWLLALSGTLSIALGVLLALLPLAGLLVIALWTAGYAIASGVLMLVLGFQLRAYARHPGRQEHVAAG